MTQFIHKLNTRTGQDNLVAPLGPTGPVGPTGPAGGTTGATGTTGAAGSNGTNGTTGATGTTGASAVIVPSAFTSTAIQDAVDSLGVNGGTIQLLSGTYVITESIVFQNNNITLQGAGWTSILDASTAQTFHVININGKTEINIKNLKIIGKTGGTQNTSLIYSLGNGTVVQISSVYFKNSDTYGVFSNQQDWSNPYNSWTVEKCVFDTCYVGCAFLNLVNGIMRNNYSFDTIGQGFYINGGTACIIEGNNSSRDGQSIALTGENNVIKGNTSYRTRYYSAIYTNGRDNIITDNNIIQPADIGIYYYSEQQGGSIISNNSLTGCVSTAISVKGFAGDYEYKSIISNNNIRIGINGVMGISLENIKNFKISDNFINHSPAIVGSTGIQLINCQDIFISENSLEGDFSVAGMTLDIACSTNILFGNHFLGVSVKVIDYYGSGSTNRIAKADILDIAD